jgi:glycosyltransferase involved in cell wall biosynthesis
MTNDERRMTQISVIIPLYNEAENLSLLHQELTDSLTAVGCPYEIIFVDDGSRDGSLVVLKALYQLDPEQVRIIELRRNFGKTAALVAGFQQARGDILITMDADLQDDPGEINSMVATLNEGYDLVAAWRKERQDRPRKQLSSRIFNSVVSRLAGVDLHDFNCGFKIYRREVIESVRLYSDLHRYIAVLAAWHGFRVAEKEVVHHPRHAGVSKYGSGRVARGFMDLVMVLFITRYLRYPLRLFGWAGFLIFTGGGVVNLYLAGLWLLRFLALADVPPIGTRPLLTVGVLGMLLGLQLISIGLLGEMLRYFTYQPSDEFSIRRIWQ